MARVVITIEDEPNGRVKMVCDPTYSVLAQRITSGADKLTEGEGIALFVINEVRKTFTKRKKSIITLPRVWHQGN